ncbi:ribose ABC transporter [Ktedonosporobacter rubrisoli]|uniref:Ribose ABC transporter n=1 Tax=Ktedonosporobacter rubrisoli TaxID=2509675 RepID=A0A4P6K1J0_KTERU|nr:ribose ABC transporter [Ktedonosporobacter rubrisoli]QBD81692.1 ribose ABC transporter [Ktedonosporobacter rubrisoli]
MQASKSLAQPARRPIEIVSQFWAWLFLLALIIFFSISGQGFLSFFNIQSIGTDMAFALIMALGQTFVIIAGGIDLSTGFIMGLSAVVSAQVLTDLGGKLPLPAVILLGMLAGIAVGVIPGLCNGIIIGRLRVPPFIVTLGMYGIARGVGFLLSGGQPVSVQVNGIGDLGNGYLFYFHPSFGLTLFHAPANLTVAQQHDMLSLLPYPLILIVVLVLICHWLLTHTRFGQHTYAIGGNQEASLRAGIPVIRHTVAIYMLSALLSSIAGVLYTLRFTNGAANAGDPLLLDSIAAVVIGGASLFGGEGTIIGTLIGALIIAVIQNGLVIIGIEPYWQFVAVGVIIILAVLVDQAKARVVE